MIYHRICKTGTTSGADITYSSGEPGVTQLSSYMICHRICKTGGTSGADITFVVVTTTLSLLFQPTISLEMPVTSQGHYGFHSFPVVD
jgi:hypothetical protein